MKWKLRQWGTDVETVVDVTKIDGEDNRVLTSLGEGVITYYYISSCPFVLADNKAIDINGVRYVIETQ